MPYNPSSAYPRHSTYTPPVYGREFPRAFNEVPWDQRFGPAAQGPGVDIAHALQRAARPLNTENIGLALQAQNRGGLVSMAVDKAYARGQQRRETTISRKFWNRAEYGDDPNEQGEQGSTGTTTSGPPPTAAEDGLFIPTSQSRGPARERESTFSSGGRGGRDPLLADRSPFDVDPFASPVGPSSQTGGRPHVGGTNDRINAIAQRVTTSSAMNDTVNKVLSGKIGGAMTVPQLIIGSAINRRRRK